MTIILVMVGVMLACGFAGGIIGYMISDWRRESRKLDADIASYQSPGRHRMSEPRQDRTSLVRDETPSPRPAQRPAEGEPEPSDWYQAIARDHVSAANIAPVILPAPGEYRPQAGRDSGPGTVTFATGPIGIPPKLREALSTTGEIEALAADTDAWLAQRAIEDEQFRLGLALDR